MDIKNDRGEEMGKDRAEEMLCDMIANGEIDEERWEKFFEEEYPEEDDD